MVEYIVIPIVVGLVVFGLAILIVKGIRAQRRNLDEQARAQQTGRVYVFTNRHEWSRGQHGPDAVIISRPVDGFGRHPTIHDRIFIEGDPDIGWHDDLLEMFERYTIEQNVERSKVYGESVFGPGRRHKDCACGCPQSATQTTVPVMPKITQICDGLQEAGDYFMDDVRADDLSGEEYDDESPFRGGDNVGQS